MCVLLAHVYAPLYAVPVEARRGRCILWILELQMLKSYEQWKLNQGPVQVQLVLLTANPSLSSPNVPLFLSFLLWLADIRFADPGQHQQKYMSYVVLSKHGSYVINRVGNFSVHCDLWDHHCLCGHPPKYPWQHVSSHHLQWPSHSMTTDALGFSIAVLFSASHFFLLFFCFLFLLECPHWS